jgi:hypothetical protein
MRGLLVCVHHFSLCDSNPGMPLVPNIDLPALCAPRFKPGPPSEEAQVLSDRLASTINACAITSIDSLSLDQLISQGRRSPALSAVYSPRTCSLGVVHRRDMHQLRRKCVRRRAHRNGCRTEKQCDPPITAYAPCDLTTIARTQQRPSPRRLLTRRQAERRARERSARHCRSSVSRFRIRLAYLTGKSPRFVIHTAD